MTQPAAISRSVNLNHAVRVRPTTDGWRIIDEYYGGRRVHTPDERGYVQMQLWHVMQLFGPHLRIGFNNIMDSEIIIVDG